MYGSHIPGTERQLSCPPDVFVLAVDSMDSESKGTSHRCKLTVVYIHLNTSCSVLRGRGGVNVDGDDVLYANCLVF